MYKLEVTGKTRRVSKRRDDAPDAGWVAVSRRFVSGTSVVSAPPLLLSYDGFSASDAVKHRKH